MSVYVEKEDGSYGAISSASFMVKDYIDDYHEKVNKWKSLHFNKLLKGEYSPVAYYMALLDMTPSETAGRVGIRVGAVKRHMDVVHFGKMTVRESLQYANVFGITLAELFTVTHPGTASIKYESTCNPWITTATVVKGDS